MMLIFIQISNTFCTCITYRAYIPLLQSLTDQEIDFLVDPGKMIIFHVMSQF